MATQKPIVIIFDNGLRQWSRFREVLGDAVEVKAARTTDDAFRFFNEARTVGGPAVIGIGCTNGGSTHCGSVYARFLELARKAGYTGPALGICRQCTAQLLEEGCNEVVDLGEEAARRILELVSEKPKTQLELNIPESAGWDPDVQGISAARALRNDLGIP